MKKLLLPLLLLLAFGMLLAVESAPSAVVGYVKYDCSAGLNLLALPMEQGYTSCEEMATPYPGLFDGINYWDAASQTWVGAVYYPAPDDVWDPVFPIGAGSVVMISGVTTPFSFYSIGTMPAANASYSILTGLNTVMLPLNKSAFNFASLMGADIGVLNGINYWDAPSQTWIGAVYYPAPDDVWDPDFEVAIGGAFMVSSDSETVWPAGPRTSTVNNKKSK